MRPLLVGHSMLERAKAWAGLVRRDIVAVWLAARDPRVPWQAKALAAAVAAYALSPLDLIPDFIPIVGYVDDLIIVPLGILLVVRLVPAELMREFRAEAGRRQNLPRSIVAGCVIVAIWISAAALLGWRLWRSSVH
jgi:uncharacterized membrane protein YkvA (DUF1232 family)